MSMPTGVGWYGHRSADPGCDRVFAIRGASDRSDACEDHQRHGGQFQGSELFAQQQEGDECGCRWFKARQDAKRGSGHALQGSHLKREGDGGAEQAEGQPHAPNTRVQGPGILARDGCGQGHRKQQDGCDPETHGQSRVPTGPG